MDMATRVARAWAALREALAAAPTEEAALDALVAWLRGAAPQVSRLAAARLASSPHLSRLLTDARSLPITRAAVRDLIAAVGALETPRDPQAMIAHVAAAAEALVLLPLGDCRRCQGEVAAWATSAGEIVARCRLLGCAWADDGEPWRGDPATLHPATRAEVLAWRPDLALVARE